jgi:ElaB/YqjD/DUF883 family membrane-anchored ribosome-binding protein
MSQSKRSAAVKVEEAAPAAKELASSASEVAQKLADTAADVGKPAAKVVDNAREAAVAGYERLSRNAQASFQQGRERSKRRANEMQDRIRSRPLVTIVAAAAVGALFGVVAAKRPGHRR